ncbi:MAG TPA: cation diffusion facilitator family transporter [Aliidongia sp.]|uniref:cation diffusion facilitator family transporter n=1 Tax=Aliidongia sp. TaxID=1914230 RepID=UPI002DDD8605|nr:cation diffusion facilitator family transporter [Aliidongia sp.]HEV2673313.1 cation diffusion facilitator family transporter [Aliidongia sp.]
MAASEAAEPAFVPESGFLGRGHERNERKTWTVIALCATMTVLEITAGRLFGSMALVADGLHMSTHAAALVIAAVAYAYARNHADDPSFAFGTGKLGDLAGFSSAIVLAIVAVLTGYEAITRLFQPGAIDFDIAIPTAVASLAVNVASAWLLSGSDDGPGATNRDNNMRAALFHVIADVAVSVLAILGLLAGKFLGLAFMDPLMGLLGMLVIANWSYALVRATGAVLLDRTPDREMAAKIRAEIELDGDRLNDLRLWRLGPGHLGAIVSVTTNKPRNPDYYRARLARFDLLSHLAIEIRSVAP